MNTKNIDVVAEYLHEVDLRLAGLPVLQRRELLADLAAHIESERAERNLRTEGELIEVLERLGAPEVVAAAAHEEAGVRPQPAVAPRRKWPVVAVVAGAGALLLLILVVAFLLFFARGDSGASVEVAVPAETAPATVQPAETAPAQVWPAPTPTRT
ncbi:MAG: hypothetical protein ABW046_01675 [Actinoplanes sp.]